ncbi:taurine ABC transporter ATP-binding protein [Zavarzinia sp. CC-PAN008]|uniref:taurine ABC transporter ATP-binding protein n=1 Tax=Zavarzinia sp. CC-PAN008 TaxID=3243332 RepID=UPI003F743B6C
MSLVIAQAGVTFQGRDGRTLRALDDVSLEIPPGGFTVALGASGCGKTTLLNVIAGFQPLTDGSVTLDGAPVRGPGPDRGVVFQKDTLYPWAQVQDNVAFGLRMAGMAKSLRRARAAELLAMVGLEGFATSYPYELSGGMRQRVSLARALATRPRLLLMDEPLGALDSLTREAMQELIADLWARTNARVFFITHSIEEALFLGTELLVMSPRPGRIVARYPLDFVHRWLATRDARAIKSDPAFVRLREEIRDLVHATGERDHGRPIARSA